MRFSVLLTLAVLLLAGCSSAPTDGEVRIQDIHGLALDPAQPTRLYVATHHGLFVAENDSKWAAVTKEPFDMMGFTMHPGDGSIMYASGHPNRVGQGWAVGVVKSTDGGRTWATLALKNEVDFHAMTMEPGSNGAGDSVYGFHGGKVHVSKDGGKTWTAKAVSFSVAALAVAPAAGDVLAATDQGLQRIGRHLEGTWSPVAPDAALAVAATEGAFFVYFSKTGLAQSIDEGTSWTSMNWTVPEDDFPWGIAPTISADVVYVATARGHIEKTTNGGASWSRVR
jgi:hypothetical protein